MRGDVQPSRDRGAPADPPWQRLGRMLPPALRASVFEPAYYDLLSELPATDQRSRRFGMRVLMLALDTYRVGAPRLLWHLMRTSRRARLVVGLTVITIVAVLLLKSATVVSSGPYQPEGGP